MSRSKKQKRNNRLQVVLEPETWAVLLARAKLERRTPTQYGAALIEAAMALPFKAIPSISEGAAVVESARAAS